MLIPFRGIVIKVQIQAKSLDCAIFFSCRVEKLVKWGNGIKEIKGIKGIKEIKEVYDTFLNVLTTLKFLIKNRLRPIAALIYLGV